MRGFSLVEVLIGLALSLVVLTGLLKFSATLSKDLTRERNNLVLINGLAMARDELMRMKERLEPRFWRRFPPRESLFHTAGHFHGGILAAHGCPDLPESDCFVFFDIRPTAEVPLIYAVEYARYPQMVALSPIDPSYPVGPSDTVAPMSVLLFRSTTHAFCALVQAVEGREVWLAPEESQPWPLPVMLPEEPLEIVHLGALSATHVGLEALAGELRQLVFRPWSLDAEGWSAGRRTSSWQGRPRLIWIPCADGLPDRLVLAGHTATARPLRPPISIGGISFQQEVRHVSLEF